MISTLKSSDDPVFRFFREPLLPKATETSQRELFTQLSEEKLFIIFDFTSLVALEGIAEENFTWPFNSYLRGEPGTVKENKE